ncbi:hypothetical protein KIW84_025287 [Lathyrus oleraceus]|uniref:Peptidase S8/S53 domain-containing protein n=1 Tax=Pisum sativum TaxID=3888 RepID=A0A9D4YHV3_PEA|nr:hypothetical protein KIW84_025287 [Pisum sativum]
MQRKGGVLFPQCCIWICVEDLREKHVVVSVRLERKLSLHRIHTPTFLGLKKGQGLWSADNLGKDITIGVIDTRINLFHPSFSGEGMPPPPAKWKCHCQFNRGTTCNNKLIGARNLVSSVTQKLPFESDIHGTHTVAIAGGRFIENEGLFENAKGVTAGMAPNGHIAIYKMCDAKIGCPESVVLAAMNKVIEDGVDVLFLSLGFGSLPIFQDPIAVGAFAAIQKGIFVSCSAGNSGPNYATLVNKAPWFLIVGASTDNRKIIASAKLGNGDKFEGVNILAAWHVPVDNKFTSYNIISGTSMSCPHLNDIAALIKRQVNHVKANDLGLVYDIHPDDYIPYFCGLGHVLDPTMANNRNLSRASDAKTVYELGTLTREEDQTKFLDVITANADGIHMKLVGSSKANLLTRRRKMVVHFRLVAFPHHRPILDPTMANNRNLSRASDAQTAYKLGTLTREEDQTKFLGVITANADDIHMKLVGSSKANLLTGRRKMVVHFRLAYPGSNHGEQPQIESGVGRGNGVRTRNLDEGRRSDKVPWCDHCKRGWHTHETCWKLKGKPPNWKKKSGRAFQASNSDQGQQPPPSQFPLTTY